MKKFRDREKEAIDSANIEHYGRSHETRKRMQHEMPVKHKALKKKTSPDHASKDCGGKCVFHSTAGGRVKPNFK